MGILTFLVIFISSFGLFGLALYNTKRHVKEIGIRKVFGANVSAIVMLFYYGFVRQ